MGQCESPVGIQENTNARRKHRTKNNNNNNNNKLINKLFYASRKEEGINVGKFKENQMIAKLCNYEIFHLLGFLTKMICSGEKL